MNLLKETLEDLAANGKTPRDVRWVGSDGACCTWEQFAELADTDYDAGFGMQEVAKDLLIVGDNWWLEREEYDGAEGWVFKTCPRQPDKSFVPRAFTVQQANKRIRSSADRVSGWETLTNLNCLGDR